MQREIKKLRAIIYVRSSGKELSVIKKLEDPEREAYMYHSISTAEQERICVDYCDENDIDVVKIFRDENTSNMGSERKGIRKAMGYCRNPGVEVDLVIVTNIDRLTPSCQYYIGLGWSLYNNKIGLISVNGGNDDRERFAEGYILPL